MVIGHFLGQLEIRSIRAIFFQRLSATEFVFQLTQLAQIIALLFDFLPPEGGGALQVSAFFPLVETNLPGLNLLAALLDLAVKPPNQALERLAFLPVDLCHVGHLTFKTSDSQKSSINRPDDFFTSDRCFLTTSGFTAYGGITTLLLLITLI